MKWSGSNGVAWWPVNARNAASLPPPSELRNLSLDTLIEILTSARPLHQFPAAQEYVSDQILPKQFEQLAREAGLARPMVKRRVPELAETILAKLPDITIEHPVALSVARLIQSHCERTIGKFKKS